MENEAPTKLESGAPEVPNVAESEAPTRLESGAPAVPHNGERGSDQTGGSAPVVPNFMESGAPTSQPTNQPTSAPPRVTIRPDPAPPRASLVASSSTEFSNCTGAVHKARNPIYADGLHFIAC